MISVLFAFSLLHAEKCFLPIDITKYREEEINTFGEKEREREAGERKFDFFVSSTYI